MFQRATDGLTLTGGPALEHRDLADAERLARGQPAGPPVVRARGHAERGDHGARGDGPHGRHPVGRGRGRQRRIPLPRLDLGGFLRVSPAVRLRLDASDLLGPLAGPRIELGAFERPGLRVVGTVQLEF